MELRFFLLELYMSSLDPRPSLPSTTLTGEFLDEAYCYYYWCLDYMRVGLYSESLLAFAVEG